MPPVKTKNEKSVKAVKQEKAAGLELEKNPPHPPFAKWGERLELPVYNMEGEEKGKINLPLEIFGLKVNMDLVKQAVEAQMSQSRVPYAHAKDRSEVRGGGRKPWRQKGTGRARHGSIRSPLWVGGGATFGPRNEKNFAKKINKKMKRLALLMALSGKARDKEIIVLDDLKLEQPKTKVMALKIKNLKLALSKDEGSKIKNDIDKGALIVLSKKDNNIIRAVRNIPRISTIAVQSLNVVDLLSLKYLIMPKEAIGVIEKIYLR